MPRLLRSPSVCSSSSALADAQIRPCMKRMEQRNGIAALRNRSPACSLLRVAHSPAWLNYVGDQNVWHDDAAQLAVSYLRVLQGVRYSPSAMNPPSVISRVVRAYDVASRMVRCMLPAL